MPRSYIHQCITKMKVFKKVLQRTISCPHLASSVGCVSGMWQVWAQDWYFPVAQICLGTLERRAFSGYKSYQLEVKTFTLMEPRMSQTQSVLTPRDRYKWWKKQHSFGYSVSASVMSSLLKVPFWRCCLCLLYQYQAQGGVHWALKLSTVQPFNAWRSSLECLN